MMCPFLGRMMGCFAPYDRLERLILSPSLRTPLAFSECAMDATKQYPRLVRHIVGSFLGYAVAMCEVVLDIWADVV